MSMVHIAPCSPRARLGSFDGLDHVSRAPTTAQDAHFHRWMPMAMVATSYLSHLTSRLPRAASMEAMVDGVDSRPVLGVGGRSDTVEVSIVISVARRI